jgi:hypothetical protein
MTRARQRQSFERMYACCLCTSSTRYAVSCGMPNVFLCCAEYVLGVDDVAPAGPGSAPRSHRRSRAGIAASCPDLLNVAVNRAAPHLLAVACADRYVRVYDRRRLPCPTAFPAEGHAAALTGFNTPDPALLFAPLCLTEGQDPKANAALKRGVM